MAPRLSMARTVIIAAATVLIGCATSIQRGDDRHAGYKATALKLGNTDYVSPGTGYDMRWTPIGDSGRQTLSTDEITRLNAHLDACVSELSRGTYALPSETVRIAQNINCMESRGWRVTVEEVVVLN
jgi:hypothetical protein